MDVWYVDYVGLWLDLKILLFMVWMVLCCDGVFKDGYVIMDYFKGNDDE